MKHENSLKPYAVITGASSGIGRELAKQFAKNGYDLLIVAENDKISDAARELQGMGAHVDAAQLDLSHKTDVEKFYERIQLTERPVDALVLNAGIGVGGGTFLETDLDEELRMLRLNVFSTVHLAKLVLKDMVARGEGKILFTSSVASTMPGPYYSVYAATKSFVQSFALAIREEVKDKGITITALMPGPTDTEFFERAHMEETKVGHQKKDDPADVARQGFEALMAGKDHVVGGSFMNRVQVGLAKVIPQKLSAKVHQSMTKPETSKDH